MLSPLRRLAAIFALVIAAVAAGGGPAVAGSASFADVRAELQQAAAALDAVYADDESDSADEDFTDEELTDDDLFDDEEPIDEGDLGLGELTDEGFVAIDRAAAEANLGHTERARALAQRLPLPKLKAKGLTAVMLQADDNLYEYEDLVEYVTEGDGLFVVGALDISRAARDRAADAVVKLAGKLPPPSRSKLLETVADATDDGDADYVLEILAYDLATDATKDALEPVLTAMIAHMGSLSQRLAKLSAKLPRAERAGVRGAAQTVDAALAYLPEVAADLVAELEAEGEQAAADAFCIRLARLPIPVPAGTCAP